MIFKIYMDYKKLLLKYIQHVIECEGQSFIGFPHDAHDFTDEELAELEKLETKAVENIN